MGNKTDKLKILEISDAYYPSVDGAVAVIRNYSKELNEISDCSLAVPKHSKKIGYIDREPFEVLRCASSSAPEGYRFALPDSDAKFVKKIADKDLDIIHAHTPFTMGRFALKAAKKKGIPVVATLHTQYHQDFERVLGEKSPLVKFMIGYIMKVYKSADSVWTVSNASKSVLKKYGFKGNIEVVRNGTDYVYPDNDKELIEKVNSLHNLKDKKNVFLFVGRMAMYKNLKLIVDAVKILKDDNKDFTMLFVGGGFDIDELKVYIAEKGVEDRCILTGQISDRKLLQGYYLRSDLLFFPSTFDMASISKVEAAAHKKASIVVEGSCSAEEVVDGFNGYLAKENAKSFAEKLEFLIANPENYKIAGENAYKTLYRTWRDVAEEVLSKYEKVIEDYKFKQRAKEKLKEIRRIKAKGKTKTKKEKVQ